METMTPNGHPLGLAGLPYEKLYKGPERHDKQPRTNYLAVSHTVSEDLSDEKKIRWRRLCAIRDRGELHVAANLARSEKAWVIETGDSKIEDTTDSRDGSGSELVSGPQWETPSIWGAHIRSYAEENSHDEDITRGYATHRNSEHEARRNRKSHMRLQRKIRPS
jgi:hypothetical protein